ncbi:MAG: hypothetical protein ACK46X_09850 [Candidatus Sericytochromatia bacterium]
MRHIVGSLLMVSCLMSACALTPGQATRATGKATVKPKVTASKSPVTASPRPQASSKPQQPAVPTVRFSGKIEVDAHYLVSNNAGSVISNGGASAIVLKGGGLISAKGLGLLSDNGLGLLSDNGLGLIANNSAGLISNNGAGYRLLAGTTVAVGTILPVKGMAVIPIAMRTGEVVGKPVFTDERGGYTLDLPQSLKGSVRIVARVPVTSKSDPIAEDPRVQYTLVVNAASGASPTPAPTASTAASPSPGASAAPVAASTINEDTALVTKYVRSCFAGRIEEMMVTQDIDTTSKQTLAKLKVPEVLLETLKGTFEDINKTAKDVGVAKMSADEVDQIAQRASDVLLSYIDLETLVTDPVELQRPADWGKKELAVAGMNEVMSMLRDGARAKMTENPAFFETQPYFVATGGKYQVRKPSDLGDFMVEEYMLSSVDRGKEVDLVFESVGVPMTEARRLNTICLGILATVGKVLFSNSEAKTEVLAAIRGAKK